MYKIIILGNCLHVLVTNAFNAMLAAYTVPCWLSEFDRYFTKIGIQIQTKFLLSKSFAVKQEVIVVLE